MAKVEQLISHRVDLPATHFSQVIAVKAEDDIEPLFVSGNFSEKDLSDDLIEPMLLSFDLFFD